MSIISKALISLVHGYQRFISPLTQPSCRYYPTCSNYMIKAVQVHGAFKGFLMGISRILRCHPFAKPGFDYVPVKFSLRKNRVDHEEPDYQKMSEESLER